MTDILIRGYKAKEQIEEIIQEARYAANNCMIGSGLEIVELPEHGELIDRDALPQDRVEWEDVVNAPVIVPSNKEVTE